MKLSAIVPLPVSVADNPASAFLPLVGQAALVRVVHAMLGAVAEPGSVVVAAAEALVADVRDILADGALPSVGIAAAAGPGSRADCLSAGLEYFERQHVRPTHVLVGDIRQPLVSTDLRERVIAGLAGAGAVVVPALAVTDSVKAVDARGSVKATVDRSVLRAAQYPRGLAVGQLAELLARYTSERFDEVQEAIRAGAPVTVVEGDADGFQAELPADAPLVEAIIASRRPDPR